MLQALPIILQFARAAATCGIIVADHLPPLHPPTCRPAAALSALCSRFAVLPIGEDNGIVEWVLSTTGLRHCIVSGCWGCGVEWTGG